jgi:hypothetical protein
MGGFSLVLLLLPLVIVGTPHPLSEPRVWKLLCLFDSLILNYPGHDTIKTGSTYIRDPSALGTEASNFNLKL